MGSRVNPTRIMCVNCNICVNKLRRYPALALDTRVTAVICSWVYPQIVLDDNYVCEACRYLAIAAANHNLNREVSGGEEAGPSTRGHTNVCLLCGCSTLHRTSDKIYKENPMEMQQSVINIIESRVAPQEISSDRVCHACWLRTKREVIRMSRNDQNRLNEVAQVEVSIDNVLPEPPSHIIPPSESPPAMETQSEIILPNYRRAANSTHHCVFPNCSSSTLSYKTVSMLMKY